MSTIDEAAQQLAAQKPPEIPEPPDLAAKREGAAAKAKPVEHVLLFFAYEHLKGELQEVSRPFSGRSASSLTGSLTPCQGTRSAVSRCSTFSKPRTPRSAR